MTEVYTKSKYVFLGLLFFSFLLVASDFYGRVVPSIAGRMRQIFCEQEFVSGPNNFLLATAGPGRFTFLLTRSSRSEVGRALGRVITQHR